MPPTYSESCSVVSDSLWPHGLYSGVYQNTRVGSLSLLQGIFPTQGSNPGLPHCRWILYQLSHKGSPRTLEWVAYPSSILQQIFLTQGLNQGLLHFRQILYQLNYQGSPIPHPRHPTTVAQNLLSNFKYKEPQSPWQISASSMIYWEQAAALSEGTSEWTQLSCNLLNPHHLATQLLFQTFYSFTFSMLCCAQSRLTLRPHALQPARLFCLWVFSRQEYWSGLPCLPPGDLPNPGIESRSPTLQADSSPTEPPGKPMSTRVGSLSLLQGIFPTQESNRGLLHCRRILSQVSYQGSLDILYRTP